jgi:hypothetical protein
VKFPTYAAADKRFGDLLGLRYGVNCRREVTLDLPDDSAAPFEMTLVFDCTEARAND